MMFKALLKKQLYQLNQSFFYDSKKGKARSKGSSIAFIVFFAAIMVGVLGGMFFYFSGMLCSPLVGAGYGWLYFALLTLVSVMMGVFGSVFNTYASLYKARDNDLLLSLPIPVRQILIVRLLGVYLMGTMYSVVVILPAVIVYLMTKGFSLSALFGSIVLVISVTVVVFVLSCILGLVVAKISDKLKNKSIVTVIFSLVFLGIYYYAYYNAFNILQKVIANVETIGEKVRGAAYPLYVLGKCGEGELLPILAVLGFSALILVLTYVIMEKSFLKIATSTGKSERKEYRAKKAKRKSANAALLSKEFSRFVSSPTYMLNCALGTLFMPVAGIAFLIKGKALLEMMTDAFSLGGETVAVLAVFAVCAIASMNDITAPSVSLEGKSIWLTRSLPVGTWQILSAKLKLHILLTAVPALFLSVCLCVVLRPSVGLIAGLIALPFVFTVFGAVLGLVINLKLPNLHWTNETAAVKQSFSVLITLFIGWIVAIAGAFGFLALGEKIEGYVYIAAVSAVVTVITLVLIHRLKTKGVKIYNSL